MHLADSDSNNCGQFLCFQIVALEFSFFYWFNFFPFFDKERITTELKEPVKGLLRKVGQEDTWASIRNRLNGLTVVSEFSNAICEFNLDETTLDTMVQELRNYGRSLVVELTREASADVLMLMKNRYVGSEL